MAVKVGEGYIDVETRLDNDSIVRASRDMADRAAATFGKNYNDNLRNAFRDADRQFDVHINKQISSFQALERQRIAAAEDSNRRVQKLYNEIASSTDRDRRFSDAAAREAARAAKSFEDEHNASFSRITTSYRKGLASLGDDTRDVFSRVHRDIDVDVDRHSHVWGKTLERNLSRGVDAALSLMPGRMEALFSGRGGPIGLAIGAALVAGVAAALPAVGAMLSGLFFAGLGLSGVIAASIVAGIDDPRVAEARARFVKTFKDQVVYHPDVQSLGQTLSDQIDKAAAKLTELGPAIRSSLNAGAGFLPQLTDAMLRFADKVIPAFDRFMNSPFMQALMTSFAAGIVKLGEAFAEIIDDWLGDNEAMEGARKGLDLFFNLLVGGLKTTSDLLRQFAKWYNEMNEDPDGPGPQLSVMDAYREAWKEFKDILDNVVEVFKKLDGFSLKNLMPRSEQTSPTGQGGVSGAIQTWTAGVKIWENYYAALIEASKTSVNAVKSWISQIPEAWDAAWGAIKAHAAAWWSNILSFLQGWGNNVSNWWTNMMRFFKDTWNSTWGGIKDFFVEVWSGVADFFIGIWTHIWNVIGPLVKLIADVIRAAFEVVVAVMLIQMTLVSTAWFTTWHAIHDVFMTVWNAMWNFFAPIVQAIFGGIVIGLNFLFNVWKVVWGAISGVFIDTWNLIWGFLVMIWGTISGWFSDRLDGTSRKWSETWGAIKDVFVIAWNTMWSFLQSIWNIIGGFLQTGWDAMLRAWDVVWAGMLNILSGAWNLIKDGVVTGINAVIGVLNSGIRLINAVLEKLGIDFRVGEIGLVGGSGPINADNRTSIRGNAYGGRIDGPGSETSDSVIRRLSKNEYVIRARSAREIGYQSLDYMNRTGKMPWGFGMAGGGRVGSENEGLLQQHANHLHVAMDAGFQAVIAAAAASGLPFTVGSTVRPGSRGSSGNLDWHHYGKAVDFMGYNQDALAAYFEKLPGVIEEIHRTSSRDYAIFGKGGNRIGSLLNEFMAKGIDWIMENMLNPIVGQIQGQLPNSVPGAIGKGTISGLVGGLKQKVIDAIEKAKEAAFTALSVAGGGNAAMWSGVAGQALSMLGLPGSWLGPLLTLIGRESGGNPNAVNRWDSNAAAGHPSMGLMQTIGPTFSRFMFPGYSNILAPLDNILAGLRYIMGTYGTIFNVQQAVGSTPRGYDEGGFLQPGLNLAYNGTGHPEPVLTDSQWDSMSNQEIKVYVDGVEAQVRTIVETNNNRVVQALRRGRRG